MQIFSFECLVSSQVATAWKNYPDLFTRLMEIAQYAHSRPVAWSNRDRFAHYQYFYPGISFYAREMKVEEAISLFIK